MGKKSAKSAKKSSRNAELSRNAEPLSAAEAFRLPEGPVQFSDLKTDRLQIGPADKEEGLAELAKVSQRLAEVQERLYAASVGGGDKRRVLLVLQGMDTAGKDGVTKKVVGAVDPGGLRLASFKKPTKEELEQDFLWRIEKQVPPPGYIGVFNRSHYEDVLIARVHDLVPREVWSKRYSAINRFERRLARTGVTIVKCFVHVSKEVQAERLIARLDDPTKHWKFNPGDIDERAHWDDYQEAYRVALTKCSTAAAPWYVIPADRKWYRNWAVAAVLLDVMEQLDPQYPPATFDVAEQRARLEAELDS